MVQLEWVFLLQAAMGVLMVIFLHKISRLQKQIDHIVKEVKKYIDFITETDLEIVDKAEEFHAESGKGMVKTMSKKEKEEAQNRLIQSVLGEYFS